MDNSGYEPTIRAVTTFFAALIGFGLKHLLDLESTHPLASPGAPCFFIAIFLFLRFITGAANHLWIEHVKADADKESSALFCMDIATLVTFGIFASFISYAENLTWFFGLSALYLLIAILWEALRFAISCAIGHDDRGDWRIWSFCINPIQGLIFAVAWWFALHNCARVGEMLWPIVGFGIVAFLVDFACQLVQIKKTSNDHLGKLEIQSQSQTRPHGWGR